MTLVLSNAEIESLLTMPACMEALEQAYRAMARKEAINRPRSDMYAPHEMPDAFYVFKSFDGLYPAAGVAALRLNSDVIAWSRYAGTVRKDKQPLADGRWVGLVLLFSTSTGEPLAIFPDGAVQRMRVGGSNGVAARHLARADAEVYGLLGAGWQAGAQLMAMATARSLREVRVYSPNPEHRAAFAEYYAEKLALPIRAVSTTEEAVRGAHIVGMATNAVGPLLDPSWLEPGMHLSCVKRSEIGEEVLGRCDRVVVHSREGAPLNYLVGVGDVAIRSHDPLELMERVRKGEKIDPTEALGAADPAARPGEAQLAEVVDGQAPRRESAAEINAYVNNVGLGIQFAALGALVYERAVAHGVGHSLPTSWFTETEHP